MVVVSALKGVTDKLLDVTKAISPDIPESVKDHIIRLGEEQSTRLISSALSLIGVDSKEFTVDCPCWPIITDDTFGNAEPIMEYCQKAVNLGLKPVIGRGVTPVVSGFVGRSLSGEVTTLGRGGTDTTATVLSVCLDADELILVKSVGGVYSADAEKIEGTKMLSELSTDEAYQLSSSGAKVLHNKVFRHKNPELGIRLISMDEDMSGSGTLVYGGLDDFSVKISDISLHEFTLVGGNAPKTETIEKAASSIDELGGVIASVEVNRNHVSMLVSGDPGKILHSLHNLVQQLDLKAVSHKEGLTQVIINGIDLVKVKNFTTRITDISSVYKIFGSKTQFTLILDSGDHIDEILTSIH